MHVCLSFIRCGGTRELLKRSECHSLRFTMATDDYRVSCRAHTVEHWRSHSRPAGSAVSEGTPSKSFTVSMPSNILLGGMVSALAASANDTSPTETAPGRASAWTFGNVLQDAQCPCPQAANAASNPDLAQVGPPAQIDQHVT